MMDSVVYSLRYSSCPTDLSWFQIELHSVSSPRTKDLRDAHWTWLLGILREEDVETVAGARIPRNGFCVGERGQDALCAQEDAREDTSQGAQKNTFSPVQDMRQNHSDTNDLSSFHYEYGNLMIIQVNSSHKVWF